jgi:hypothetical protein
MAGRTATESRMRMSLGSTAEPWTSRPSGTRRKQNIRRRAPQTQAAPYAAGLPRKKLQNVVRDSTAKFQIDMALSVHNHPQLSLGEGRQGFDFCIL